MSNENNIKIKDPEGREYDDSGSATLKKVISVICVIFSLVGIITNSIYPLTGMKKGGIFLGFTLCLIFLLYPTKIKGRRLLAYDVVLSVMGFGVGLYTFLVTDRFSMSNLQMTTMDTVMSFLAVALVIIAARRAVGNAMAILPVIFSLYALFGRYIPGLLGHGGYTLKRFLMRMYMVDEGLYGMTAQVACSYVFLFIVFGAFLSSSGVAEFFNDASNRIAGARAGGPAKVAVISSGLMGTISGSSAANVATTGVFTIPMMKKVGFSSEFAGAVESVASTGGMIMPPIMGSAAFLMMQYLGVPFSSIMRAAIFPAIFYFFSVYMWVHFTALRLGNHGLSKDEIPPIHDLKRRILLLTPLIAIIISMLIGYTAIFAAFIGIFVTLLAGLVQKDRITFKKIIGALISGAKASLTAMIACIVAGIIVGVCNLTGLGQVITYNITQISGNNLLFALFLTAFCCIILSMGLPAAACYILVATIVAPALIRMNVTPMAAHMFVFIFSCYICKKKLWLEKQLQYYAAGGHRLLYRGRHCKLQTIRCGRAGSENRCAELYHPVHVRLQSCHSSGKCRYRGDRDHVAHNDIWRAVYCHRRRWIQLPQNCAADSHRLRCSRSAVNHSGAYHRYCRRGRSARGVLH